MIKDILVKDIAGAMELIASQERNPDHNRLRSAFFYRGLPNADFHLSTSLQRNCKSKRKELEPILLANFAKYASMEEPQVKQSIWVQMILGQHHGLSTRLLDWTHSPLVALHFAMDEALDNLDQHDCVVWRINARELMGLLPDQYRQKLDQNKTFIFSLDTLSQVAPSLEQYDCDLGDSSFAMMEPPSIDQRIVNQYSFFAVIPNDVNDIEKLLQDAPIESVRYIIRKEIRWDIRDMLDQFNVNERIIYPGLDGISRWLDRHYFVK